MSCWNRLGRRKIKGTLWRKLAAPARVIMLIVPEHSTEQSLLMSLLLLDSSDCMRKGKVMMLGDSALAPKKEGLGHQFNQRCWPKTTDSPKASYKPHPGMYWDSMQPLGTLSTSLLPPQLHP